jgi:hypothetical protein
MSQSHSSEEKKMVPAERMQELLRRSFAMRAAFYAEAYDVLREKFGRDEAMRLCLEMTRRMGEKMGKAYSAHGPADLAGLKDAFLGGIIEGEALFAPELKRCDGELLAIDFHRCPLKEAWAAAGRDDADLEDLCLIAGRIDTGLFEAAGFSFAGETWKPGESGCCKLRVLPGPPRP